MYPSCRHDEVLRRSRDTAPGKARPPAAELGQTAEPRASTLTISALQALHLALVEQGPEWWTLLGFPPRTAAPQTCQASVRSEILQHYNVFAVIGLPRVCKCSEKPVSVSQQGAQECAVQTVLLKHCQSLQHQQQDQLDQTSGC